MNEVKRSIQNFDEKFSRDSEKKWKPWKLKA
jgi:hypothetical protein